MNFTYDWFSPIIPVIEPHLRRFTGKPVRMLEIGCFEGKSTVWFLENVLTHPKSSITCVDTFEGGSDHSGLNLEGLEGRFRENVAAHADQVSVIKGNTWVNLPLLPAYWYHVVFVDGSHETVDVLNDSFHAYRLCVDAGIIIFDDYGWGPDRPSRPQIAIDAFLSGFKDQIKVLAKEYAVVVEKLP